MRDSLHRIKNMLQSMKVKNLVTETEMTDSVARTELSELEAEEVEEVEYEEVEPATEEARALAAQWRALLAAVQALHPVGRYRVASVSYRRWVLLASQA